MSVDAARREADARPVDRHERRRHVLKLVGRYALLTFLAAVVLFPIYITVVSSLLTPQQIGKQPPTLFPTHPQFSSYSDAWSAGHLGTYLKNSFIVTIIITRRPGRDGHPRGLRVRVPRVPVQAASSSSCSSRR